MRKPRSLDGRLRWKATELRQFLLYTGPVVLYNVLASPVYNNFMMLSVATHILLSPQYCNLLNEFAHTCLVSFVEHFSRLYGPEFVAYNVHRLVHISGDVKQHGNLDEFSAFPFENYLGKLKKLVRKPDNPLVQIIQHLSEMDNYNNARDDCLRKVLRKEHKNGPVPPVFSGVVNQFQEVLLSGSVIRTSEGDNCVRIHNSIAIVVNIILFGGKIHLVYKEYRHRSSFFHYPMNSCDLGIFIVNDLSDDLNPTVLGDSMKKYVRLPFRGKFVVVPLLHTTQVHDGMED